MASFEDRMPVVALLAFGGAGLAMIAGAVALGVHGEPGGAAALGAFGLVFVAGGILAWRVFTPREGEKEILVAERTGESVTARRYVRVDAGMSAEEVEALQGRWREAPWTQRPDWAAGRIVQEGAGTGKTAVVFMGVLNVVAWAVTAFVLHGDPSAWLVAAFPVLTLIMGVRAVRLRIRENKFGTSVIACSTVPAWVGERFRGVVETGVPLRGRGTLAFRVRLACLRRRTRSVHEDGRSVERVEVDVLWKGEETAHGRISASGPVFQLPLDLALPEGFPPTELLPEDDRTLWQLELSASDPGVDYAAVFELPVYVRQAGEGPAGEAASTARG